MSNKYFAELEITPFVRKSQLASIEMIKTKSGVSSRSSTKCVEPGSTLEDPGSSAGMTSCSIEITDILALADKQTSLEHLDLLNKILASVKKIDNNLTYKLVLIDSIDDIANLNFNKLIIFGDIASLRQPLEQNYFENHYNVNKANILLTEHVIDLSKDNNKKRELWQQLQDFCS